MKTIALITDFGTQDIYVGVMKGVIRGIYAEVDVIDVTHGITPQSVREGALALLHSYRYFPAGTTFLVIVDPGVGSARRPLVVKAGGYTFIAPDNGILTYVMAEMRQFQAHVLENPRYRLPNVSHTFHGRDIFAPAAAHLAAGVDITRFGPPVDEIVQLPQPTLEISDNRFVGEITHIDHYGNLVTSIGWLRHVEEERLLLEPMLGQGAAMLFHADHVVVRVHNETIYGVRNSFHEGARGELMAHVDSNNYLEIAINQGNAAQRLQAAVGDIIEVHISAGDDDDETGDPDAADGDKVVS